MQYEWMQVGRMIGCKNGWQPCTQDEAGHFPAYQTDDKAINADAGLSAEGDLG